MAVFVGFEAGPLMKWLTMTMTKDVNFTSLQTVNSTVLR